MPEFDYADPLAERLRAQRALLQKAIAPRLNPGQIADRQWSNDRDYQLGMLGVLSGDEGLGQVGNTVLRKAIADRTPRVTDTGAYDDMTGSYTLHPEVQRQRQEAELGKLEDKSAEGHRLWQAGRQAAQERAEAAAAQRAWQEQQAALTRAAMSANRQSNEPLVQAIDPATGQPMFVRRSQAAGMQPAPSGGGNVTEGERLAAGFADRMTAASGLLGQFEAKGKATATTELAGTVPWAGSYLRREAMSPVQQQYRQAAEDWVRAKLRKESGAVIGASEMSDEIATYFPMPGDLPPVIAQKAQARDIATQGMLRAAGRAMTPPPPLPGYSPNVPQSLPTNPARPGGALPRALAAQQGAPAAADPLGLFR